MDISGTIDQDSDSIQGAKAAIPKMRPNPTYENDGKKNYAENKYKEDFNFDGREIAR